tara:strand:- start:897 stop:1721 length:825 start_codon:yes stop_codon:yes gene_type:complete
MARKQRNSVDYFPHDVNHGKGMFYLRTKYGNDGYAVWFMLLEKLGKAEFHYLDLKDNIQLMFLSSELKVSEKVLIEIIELLVKFGDFDKDLWEEESIIYNQKFIDSINDAYRKRANKCVDRNSILRLLIGLGRNNSLILFPKQLKQPSKGVENPQSKVKDSKVNKTKEELKSKKLTKKDFKKMFLDLGAQEEHIDDWFTVRDKKKAVYTKTAFKKIVNECSTNNYPIAKAIKNCAERGWQGFEYAWLKNINQDEKPVTVNRQTEQTYIQNGQNW